MKELPEYIQAIEEGKTFIANHSNLLKSLLLSKQANDNNVYTDETTNGSADVNVGTGQGIGQPGDSASA